MYNKPYSKNAQQNRGQQTNQPEEERLLQEAKQILGSHYDTFLDTNKLDYNEYIASVKTFVGTKLQKSTTHQLRNIFSAAKKSNNVKTLFALRPKLAYTYGRSEKDVGVKMLCLVLDDLIQKVKTEEQRQEFLNFFEAIIAYHKFYGGK